jgi:hypothetical protein
VLQLLNTCGSCAALISPAESSEPASVPSLHSTLSCWPSKRLLRLLLLLRLLFKSKVSNTNSSLRGDHALQSPQFPQYSKLQNSKQLSMRPASLLLSLVCSSPSPASLLLVSDAEAVEPLDAAVCSHSAACRHKQQTHLRWCSQHAECPQA